MHVLQLSYRHTAYQVTTKRVLDISTSHVHIKYIQMTIRINTTVDVVNNHAKWVANLCQVRADKNNATVELWLNHKLLDVFVPKTLAPFMTDDVGMGFATSRLDK